MITIILYLISFLLLICALVLLVNKKRSPAEIILIVWQLLLSTVYGLQIFQWEITVAFSNGVFLYLYTRCMLIGNNLSKKDLLFLIPSAIIAIIFIFYPNAIYDHPLYIYTALISWLGIFFWMAIKLVIDYKRKDWGDSLLDFTPNLKWVIAVIATTILCHSIKISPALIYYLEGTRLDTRIVNLTLLSILLCIALIAIRFDLTFILKEEKEKEKEKEKPEPYATYNLEENEVNSLVHKLIDLMQNEKRFLDPDLNLKDLSDSLNIPNHHLSFVLNTRLNQNFNEFVNSYRLDEVKKELINPKKKHYSILAIACDCGFKSQSTFNRAFKQREGVSPSQYREQQIA